jgi:hypothetical protein
MENTEYSNSCDFCDAVLDSPWFTIKASRYVGLKVNSAFRLQMCQRCYPKIHHPVHHAAFELMRQRFQDAVAEIKQELQAAGKI